jgi:hypothetical protein
MFAGIQFQLLTLFYVIIKEQLCFLIRWNEQSFLAKLIEQLYFDNAA